MALSVWITTTAGGGKYPNEYVATDLVPWARSQVEAYRSGRFRAAPSADAADLILYIESPVHKFRDYADTLLSEAAVRNHPERCFAFDWEDNPAGFLPGVYVSMLPQKMRTERFRAGGFIGVYNRKVLEYADVAHESPRYLFSFCGSASSRVRDRLFAATFAPPLSEQVKVKQTFSWFNHGPEEVEEYAKDLFESRFVLCPRGLGTATWRLFETLAIGRVPVILSDEWVPPQGPSWADFSLRLAEDRIDALPDVLAQYDDEWRDMGARARDAYEDWYRPEASLRRILEYLEQILLARPASHREADFRDRWLSYEFAYQNGWTPLQKVHHRIRSGKFWERVSEKLTRSR